MFYKRIAVSIFIIALFFVFAKAQTIVSSETSFKNLYYAGGEQNIALSKDLNFATGNSGNFGVSGGGLVFNVDLQNHSILFENGAGWSNGGVFLSWSPAKLSFSNGTLNFITNTAPETGGVAYIFKSGLLEFLNSTVYFTGNIAGTNGGAINNDGGTLNIENSEAFFSGNVSNYAHGGAVANFTGTFNITGSTVTFDSSKCAHNGGALYFAFGSKFNVADSSVAFTDNASPEIAGALYMYSSEAAFANSSVDFIGNKASWWGGAISLEQGSAINFVDSTVNFEGNQSSQGGAITLGKYSSIGALVNFENSDVYFTGNKAGNAGGAIYNEGSKVIFNPGADNEVIFTNNTASGGASNDIHQLSNGTTTFKGLGVTVIGSGISGTGLITKEDDGTLYINANSINYTGTFSQSGGTTAISASFFNGTNNINGGTVRINDGGIINKALLMSANSLLNINVTGNYNLQHSKFTGDEYDVLKTNSGTLNISEDFGNHTGTFRQEEGITAVTNKIFDSQLTINGGTLIFADGAEISPNTKIDLGENAVFNITSSGDLDFAQNFLTGSGELNKIGSATLSISGDNSGYSGVYTQNGGSSVISARTFSGAHNINNGDMEWATGTVLSGGSTFYIGSNGVLNITGAKDITVNGGQLTSASEGIINKTGLGKLIFGGNIAIAGTLNASEGELTFKNGANYKGGTLNIDGAALDMHDGMINKIEIDGDFSSLTNLKIDVFSDGTNDEIKAGAAYIDGNIDIFAGVGTYEHEEYNLIITSDSLYGVFSSSALFTSNSDKLTYELKYEDGIVKLIIDGVRTTKFGELSPLTYNQKQTAKAFEKISADPGQWAQVLDEMAARQNHMSDLDVRVVLEFLSKTSGYFLSNVVRNLAADSPNNEVYDKIRERQSEEWGVKSGETANGLWVQLKGGVEKFKKDENSLEDYRDLSLGVMFGFDSFVADSDFMWGVYGRINKDTIEQGKHKADGNKNGLGLYGGYLKDNWELKAMLLGSYDRFNTERMTYGGDIAKADINAVTVSADIEAALKIYMNDNMNFRPYAGIEAANSMYNGFKESGAGIYNLDTQSGNYFRGTGRIGAGLDYEKKRWIWYANVESKYVFDGTKPEVTSKFTGTVIDFNSRGAEEGKIQIGVGAGAEVRISENWKGFANAKYYAAQRYENLYGNIGVRYMFDTKQTKERKKAEKLEAQRAKQLEQERLQAELQARLQEKLEQERLQKLEQIRLEEERRIAEEAKITKEISDEDLAKQKEEAEERRHRPMLKTYSLTTNFRTDSYFLTEEFKEQLKDIAEDLKNYDYKKITIEGHTDSTGSKEWNKKLSRQRAKSVYDEFIKTGVSEEKMSSMGFADTMPVDSNKTKEGRAANRRTEIFIE